MAQTITGIWIISRCLFVYALTSVCVGIDKQGNMRCEDQAGVVAVDVSKGTHLIS